MESLLGPRSLGEESLQMWNLNKRLEAYLARVKYLEEENELLKAEIQELRVSPQQEKQPWRSHYEGEVATLRAALDQAFREQGTAELARESLYAEVQRVKGQYQKERGAREEAKRLLSLSRKELEEEKRAQLWLREKAFQLEKEREALVQGHQEDLAALEQEVAAAASSWALESFQAAPAPAGSLPQAEAEDYAQRLSSLWKGAVETYQAEVCQLEAALCQAKENLWKATEGHRQSQQQLQQLENALSGLKLQKEMLEESLAQGWQQQQGEAEKMQLAIESLEEEKRSLRVQIAQVLEDRQQLMHLKMSLSLEVATYRTLLETESTRLQLPATSSKIPGGLKDSMFEASHTKLQVASLGREYFGSWDFKPSPTSTLKGKPWLLKSQTESFATNLVSTLPKSCRSPVAREFQTANIVLQSQPSKTFDIALNPKDIPDFTEVAAAFTLGSSQQNELIEATEMETVSPSFFHDFPPGQNFLSHVNGEVSEEGSGSSMGQRSQEEGEGGDEVTQREAEEPDTEGGEEEEQPKEETSAAHDVPSPTQLVMETLSMAATEVNGEKICLEPNSSTMSETQKGSPSMDEEKNREASSPSREELEGAAQIVVPEGQKRDGQSTERAEEGKGVEHTIEANGGQESYPEWTEVGEEEGERLWVAQETEPAFSLQRGFPKEARGREATATGLVPLAAEMEVDKEVRPSEQGGATRTEEPHVPLKVEQGEEPKETHMTPPGPLGQLGKDAKKESWQPSSPSNPHKGVQGGSVEEMEGKGEGEKDLEVGGTESLLHLSEEEEEEKKTPSKGENECEELQAEMAGRDLGMEGGFALHQQSPISHTTSAAASSQELLSRQVVQKERQEDSQLLCERNSALADEEEAEEEEEESLLGPKETISRNKTPEARGEGGGENTLAVEVRATGTRMEEDEEERREEIPKDMAEEENPLGEGDTVEGESSSSMDEETQRHDFPLFHKGQGNLEREETAEQEGFSEVEHIGQKDLQEENKLGNEVRTGQDRFSGTETVGQKTIHKEENNLESQDIIEQEGFSEVENIGQEDLQEREREMETKDTIEQEGFSEVEHIEQKDLQEENTLGNEDMTEQDRFSDMETVLQKTPHKEENNLESEDTIEQEGLSDMEHMGHKDFPEKGREMETELTTEREGFSDVENTRQKALQEEENDMENEDSIDMESFLDMEDIGDYALHQEENHLGGTETAKEQEGISSTENIGHLGLHQDVKNLENEDATDKQSLSGVETSKHKTLSRAKNNMGNEKTVKQDGVTGVQDVAAKDLPKEENVLGNGSTTEKTSFSDVEIIGAKGLQKEEKTLGNEDPAEQEILSGIEMIGSQDEVACQPDVAFLRDEDILGQEGCEQQQAEETSNNSEERPWMEEEEGREDMARLSPVAESDIIIGEDSKTGLEALAMGSEAATGTWERGEVAGAPKADYLEGEENSPKGSATKESGTDGLEAKGGQREAAVGEEKDFHSQDTTPLEQAPASQELLAPSETHSHVSDGLGALEEYKDRAIHELPRDYSASEESLGSLDASPNATCEMDALGKEELRSRKHILLEETLPDNTPLYMYDEQMWGVAGTDQWFPESQEVPSSQGRCVSPGLEEERLRSPPLRGDVQEQEATEEEGGGHPEGAPGSQELPQASTQLEKTNAGKAGLSHESQNLHVTELEGPRREEGSVENPELLAAEPDKQSFNIETSTVGSSGKLIGQAYEEENDTDLAVKGSVSQTDLLDAHHPKESCCCEEDARLLELSESNTEGESDACKASLTSVANLGEIVLEGDAAESKYFEAGQEEGVSDVHESQPFSPPGSCGAEEELFETHPGSKDFPEGPTEAESMKDANILEIVAQALEFNQELIKAAEERAEAELSAAAAAAAEETIHSPEEKPPSDSVPLSEVGESQVLKEVPNVSSSSSTQDPTESNPLWVASDTKSLQLDLSLSDFTKDLELNGMGGLPPSGMEYDLCSPFAEEFTRKVTLTQEGLHREETVEAGLSMAAEMPASDEAQRTGKVISLFPEEECLEDEAQERKESRTADQLQTVRLKGGKEDEAEAVPLLPHLEVEIPGLESEQLLKFQAGEEDLWAQEDK